MRLRKRHLNRANPVRPPLRDHVWNHYPTGFRRAWVVLGSVAAIMLLTGVVVLVWRYWGDSRQTASDGTTSTTSASPSPPALTAASPTVPMRAPEPGLVNDAADPCSLCDTPNVKFFKSPSGNITCEIDYR